MDKTLEISLLGELRVVSMGAEVPLPASRKTRALLAFLIASGRPHRRERLCELFWDLPDDPRAALRWSLSKLREVVDAPERARIVADRERAEFDGEGVAIDTTAMYAQLRGGGDDLAVEDLEGMAHRLERVLLDGLDGAGDERFDAWLAAEREDARIARVDVLRRLATHPQMTPVPADKWFGLWREADPSGVDKHRQASSVANSPTPDGIDVRPKKPRRLEARGGPEGGGGASASTEPRALNPRTIDLRRQELRAQQIRFCEGRDGTKIAYATLGSGRPLLKAANWLNHLEFDWNSPIWGRSFAEIARHRTFIRYDERGCGLSDWDVADLSFEAFVDDLEAVAEKLGLERFPLLGISQGCAVAVEYAARHPERVSGLVLLGGYAAGWQHLTSPEEQAVRETVIPHHVRRRLALRLPARLRRQRRRDRAPLASAGRRAAAARDGSSALPSEDGTLEALEHCGNC